MDRQDVYDRVKKHLLTQKKKSMDDESCAYRGFYGLMCAIGCLIKDEFFDLEFNTAAVDSCQVLDALRKSGVDVDTSEDRVFLARLQGVHDSYNPADWKDKLKSFADEHGLNP